MSSLSASPSHVSQAPKRHQGTSSIVSSCPTSFPINRCPTKQANNSITPLITPQPKGFYNPNNHLQSLSEASRKRADSGTGKTREGVGRACPNFGESHSSCPAEIRRPSWPPVIFDVNRRENAPLPPASRRSSRRSRSLPRQNRVGKPIDAPAPEWEKGPSRYFIILIDDAEAPGRMGGMGGTTSSIEREGATCHATCPGNRGRQVFGKGVALRDSLVESEE